MRGLPIRGSGPSCYGRLIDSTDFDNDSINIARSEVASNDLPVELVPTDGRYVCLRNLECVVLDLRYAGTNNFAGYSLYRNFDCAWIHGDAFRGLKVAAEFLRDQGGPWSLLVLDALRPQRVQESIWSRIKGTPLEAYFADPAHGSIHSFGMAVDVSLVDGEGRVADMGSGFDQMDALSHPSLETQHLREGRLTSQQIVHRQLLRSAMSFAGFSGIDSEWWHFDFGDRTRIRATYPRVV